MTEQKSGKENATFIIISFLLLGITYSFKDSLELTPVNNFGDFLANYISYIIVWPLVALWFQGFWNKIIVKIFSINKIDYLLSLGLLLMLAFFFTGI
jgi:hypothetical protein